MPPCIEGFVVFGLRKVAVFFIVTHANARAEDPTHGSASIATDSEKVTFIALIFHSVFRFLGQIEAGLGTRACM